MCPSQMHKCIPWHCLLGATWAAGTEKEQQGRKGNTQKELLLVLFVSWRKQFLGFELCKSVLCCHSLTGIHSPFFQGDPRQGMCPIGTARLSSGSNEGYIKLLPPWAGWWQHPDSDSFIWYTLDLLCYVCLFIHLCLAASILMSQKALEQTWLHWGDI